MDLGFVEAVTSSFGFLLDWGFRCVRREATLVRYESNCAFITVYHGRTSHELSVELGLFSPRPRSRSNELREGPPEFVIGFDREEGAFTIWEVARFSRAPDVDEHAWMQASTPERVAIWVPKLAELTRRCAEPIRFCDEAFFRALDDWNAAESIRLGKERRLQIIRTRVNEAWRRKEYREVVSALEPLCEDLTPAERLKLEYAKKHTT